MEIGHDAAVAGCAVAHALQQGGGVGVVQLQVGAGDGIELFLDVFYVNFISVFSEKSKTNSVFLPISS